MTLQNLGSLGEFVAAIAPGTFDFGGAGSFLLPYYRSSWPLYRPYLTAEFVRSFEKQYGLDPSIEVVL